MRHFLEQMSQRAPASVEVARRLRRQVRRWWRHQRTSTYLLSYPGCGRTWLTILVGKVLVDELGLTGANPARLVDLARMRRGVPLIDVRHDGNPQLHPPEKVERDKSRFARKPVVLLVRDPRDAIISYYFEASKRRGRFEGTASQFLRHPIGGLDTLLTYYNIWAENRQVPRRFCLVRYEDLHTDPVAELGRVMDLVGLSPSTARLQSAVEFSRFENMRKLEEKGFARADIDRHNPSDAESFKARKGKVGGYREYLTPEDIDYMEKRIAERLSPFYAGYVQPT